MSPESSKTASSAFKTFIELLPSAWLLFLALEGNNNHNSPESLQRLRISPKLSPINLLSTVGTEFEKLILGRI
jgi:hypothetical protein